MLNYNYLSSKEGYILELLPRLAKKIIHEVKKLISEDIIIVSNEGYIVASTDSRRLNKFHEGALECIRTKKNLIIDESDLHKFRGVKPGVNFPLIYNQKVIGVIGITGNPDKVMPYGKLLKKMTELMIHEKYITEQIDWEQKTLVSFVFDWLQLKTLTTDLVDRAKLINFDTDKNRQIILFATDNQDSRSEKFIKFITHKLLKDKKDYIISWGSDRFLVLLEGSRTSTTLRLQLDDLKKEYKLLFDSDIFIGVGQVVQPNNLYISYEQSCLALEESIRKKELIFEEHLRIEMLLREIPSDIKKEYLKRTIDPLIYDEQLIGTLRCFFKNNLSIKETAEEMHIHINTLHYRLKKIEEKTGISIKKFENLVTFYLGTSILDNSTKLR
ncbi:MAG: Transcriptional regulator [Bacillales bacterium]|jgi:carbohydrate diacid regulator|nr:Transcriptional regulator [Bacillales bacterium]